MAQLKYKDSEQAPITLKAKTVVGRSPEHAEVVINDKRLSRKHCELRKEGGVYFIEDLKSSNGTKVNGKAITLSEALHDDDEISLGGLCFIFSTDSRSKEERDKNLSRASGLLPTILKAEDFYLSPPSLKMLKGSLRTVLVNLETFPFTIGRKEGNDLIIDDDPQVSSKHCRFELGRAGEVKLIDLRSTNGVKVDGKPVKELLLQDKMRIQVGSQLFRFHSGELKKQPAQKELAKSEESPEPSLDLDSEVAEQVLSLEEVGPLQNASALKQGEEQLEAEILQEESIEKLKGNEGESKPGRKVWVVRSFEIVLVLCVAAAVIALALFVHSSANDSEKRPQGPVVRKPLLPGGLLQKNPSFETNGQEGYEGQVYFWEPVVTSETDWVVGKKDAGVGGSQVLKVERYAFSLQRTEWACQERFLVTPEKEYEASVWAKNIKGRGSAFVFIEWFADEDDLSPLRREYGGFAAPGEEWKQLKGLFKAPLKSTFARFGVGVSGQAGSILFDQARIQESLQERTHSEPDISGENLEVKLNPQGSFELFLTKGNKDKPEKNQLPLLTNIKIELVSKAGKEGLLHDLWGVLSLADRSENQLQLKIFDPEIEAFRKVSLSLEQGVLTSTLEADPESSFAGLKIHARIDKQILVQDAVALRHDKILAYGKNIPAAQYDQILFTDTKNKHKLKVEEDSSVEIEGKLIRFSSQNKKRIGFYFDFYDGADTYHNLLEKAQASYQLVLQDFSQASENQKSQRRQRLKAGLELLSRFPFDSEARSIAQAAISSVKSFYRIRRNELAEIIRARSSMTLDASLYLGAIKETEKIVEELRGLREDFSVWRTSLEDIAFSKRLPSELTKLYRSVLELSLLLEENLDAYAKILEQSSDQTFQLQVQSDQEKSTLLLASALEHFGRSENTQAHLQLRSLIKEYSYGYNATLAKGHLVEILREMVREEQRLNEEGLDRIAEERRVRILDLSQFLLAAFHSEAFFVQVRNLEVFVVSSEVWEQKEAELREEVEAIQRNLR